MRPVKAADLVALDDKLQVVMLQCYPLPEQVVYQAGKCDYSEIPIHEQQIPVPSKCGEWIVDRLLSNDKGHWGPLEHPGITFSVAGYVHNVMVQARTHRIGITFDVQSQRYTGKRILQVADREISIEDVFYIRPPGLYTNRQGKKYTWSEEDVAKKHALIRITCEDYAIDYKKGYCEEHIRDYLTQGIRQNFVMSVNLRSVLHFLDLRAKMDAQLEIQALCHQLAPLVKTWSPNVWNYYEEKRLHRAKLSP